MEKTEGKHRSKSSHSIRIGSTLLDERSSSSHSSQSLSGGVHQFSRGDNILLKKDVKGKWNAEINGRTARISLAFEKWVDSTSSSSSQSKRKLFASRKSDRVVSSSKLIRHPFELPNKAKEFMGKEKDKLKDELTDLRLEMDILVRAFQQDYVNPKDAKGLPQELKIEQSPDDKVFEKMLETPYLATMGSGSNTPAISGTVQHVKSSVAMDMATAKTKTSDELALAPPGQFFYHDILLPVFNLNSVAEEDLNLLDSMQFDIFPYHDNDDSEYPMLLVMHMFHHLGLVEAFNIDEKKLYRFLREISCRYRKVPFHNWFHAFNVTQTMFHFLIQCNARHLLGPLEILALILSTICHDADHPGLNNSFHMKAQTKISLLHKKSTLENHHLLHGYAVLSHPECDILENVKAGDKDLLREYMRHLILATDLALHGIILKNMAERRKIIAKQFAKSSPLLEPEDKIIIMCCLIKCSDLSNEIRPKNIATKWAKMVISEFFLQSDKEALLNLPVTPFMDRSKIIIAKEQINFITKLCMPLYKSLTSVFPSIKNCIEQMKSNRTEWEHRLVSFYPENNQFSNKSIWERDQVKDKGKLSDVISKQASN